LFTDLLEHVSPVIQPQPGAISKNPQVRIGHENPFPEIVAEPIHDAEHNNERRNPDGDTPSGDYGVQ
jgi:hypothetical protein